MLMQGGDSLLSGFLLGNLKPVDSKDTRCKEFENGKPSAPFALGSIVDKYSEGRMHCLYP